jgi:hypothetical protein
VSHLASRSAVLVLVAYALMGVYAAASLLWQTPGTIGLATDYGATVRDVTPGTPAARAGIVSGDRIDLAGTPFAERSYVSGPGTTVPIGTTVTVRIVRNGADRVSRLTAVPQRLTVGERAALLFACIGAVIFIAVGATLILLRPSPATWGFGLYCLLTLPTNMYALPWPSARVALASTFVYDVVQNAGVAGLLLFVLEFPRSFAVAWRERVRRSLPLIFVVLAVMTLYPDIANQLLARGARIENDVLQTLFGLTFALAVVILCDTYRRVPRDDRERLRWVLIGFGFGLIASYIGATLIFSTMIALAPPPGVSIVLTSLNVLLPIAVAHAVIRHRVLEIRLVIGRAVVFAVLTTILAAIFALLDYVFGTVLEDFRLSRLIAAVISLAIAFAFKWLEERATTTIEGVFFRKRRAAEARLERAAHALPQARSVAVIQTTLVGEAADAFELSSAALYERDATAGFRRTISAGGAGNSVTVLDDTDLLVLDLRAGDDPVDLTAFVWRRDDVPTDERKPAVAVPIHVRGNLLAFTLYGSHAGGGALETGEIELLKRLADAAGIAFDQLEAQRLRDENERQRAVIGDLTARLDELRHR